MVLNLRIILEKPPANVHFGLQKGSGNNYESVQIQLSGSADLRFNLIAEVKGDRQNGELPDFKGPFVQGPKLGRFIYIDIGTYAGKTDAYSRRLKIPQAGITWDIIDKANNKDMLLETVVPGTAKDGTPTCATVKPFNGWHIKKK